MLLMTEVILFTTGAEGMKEMRSHMDSNLFAQLAMHVLKSYRRLSSYEEIQTTEARAAKSQSDDDYLFPFPYGIETKHSSCVPA